MKLVIGLAGMPLAGKETVATKLEELIIKDGFTVRRHRFSDILRDTLDLWGISHGRANEQILAQIMQRPGTFPEGVLARATKHRLMKDTADVGILDGMRWDVDETMLREFPAEGISSLIIYVDADDDHRYSRLIARNRNNEGVTTREQFVIMNQQQNEKYIPHIGDHADITFINNFTAVSDFEEIIETAYRDVIRLKLK
jgi:dephospho-CoA kinase